MRKMTLLRAWFLFMVVGNLALGVINLGFAVTQGRTYSWIFGVAGLVIAAAIVKVSRNEATS